MMMAASATVLFSACSADSDLMGGDNTANNQSEIGFNIVANNNKTGRATMIGSSNLTTDAKNFDVWCFDGTNAYMNGFKIEYGRTGHENAWFYADDANKRYWTNTSLDFYAVNPSALLSEADKTAFTSTNKKFSYTVIDEYASTNTEKKANIDVLYATALGQKKGSTNTQNKSNYVTMNFKHALSQLLFKVAYDGTTITGTDDQKLVEVESITLCNVQPTGTFTFPTTTDGTGSMQASGDKINITVPVANNSKQTVTTTAAEVNGSSPILVIPQTLTGGTADGNLYLAIKCKIKANGSYIVGSADEYGEVKAGLAASTTWEMGKKYTYTLTFSAADEDLIMFDATAENWGDASGTITVQ